VQRLVYFVTVAWMRGVISDVYKHINETESPFQFRFSVSQLFQYVSDLEDRYHILTPIEHYSMD
jgi:hypothetical protein